MTDCVFITCRRIPFLDADDRIALAELAARGIGTSIAIWDDPLVDWSRARLCILRSTWDYHLHYARFIDWLTRVGSATTVRNDPQTIRWSADKSYLESLQSRGVPVVPTVAVPRGGHCALAAIAESRGWRDVVVKPRRGAASHAVLRASLAVSDQRAAAQAHLEAITRLGDALIQPYLSSVQSYGERALVFFAGRFSHAVRKKPFDTELAVDRASTRVAPTCDELAVASKAIAALDEPPLYARVDLLRGASGEPYLNELELVEPTLYFQTYEPARRRFADAVELTLASTPARWNCPKSPAAAFES